MDFGCLRSFVVSLELAQLCREQPVHIHWHCLMPRPLNAAPLPLMRCAAEDEHRRHAAERLQFERGIVLRPGPIGIQTYAAHLAVKYAQKRHKGRELLRALLHAYWLDGRSIDSLEVIKEIAAEVGLDPADLATGFNDSLHAKDVAADAIWAREVGVRGAPALLFAKHYLVSGTQTVSVWKEVLLRVRAREYCGSPLERPVGVQTPPSGKLETPLLVQAGNPHFSGGSS
jgi:predicted DsbA family dithiol-disulfide isomerase